MNDLKNFAIIGSGSWGTAIAGHIAKVTNSVMLYSRSKEIMAEINNHQTNTRFFGNIILPKNIVATDDMGQIAYQDVIFIVVPSTGFSEILDELAAHNLSPDKVIVIATKGIASDPVQLFSEEFQTKFKNPFAFFSGPNLAKEIAEGKFASATISSNDINLANSLAKKLSTANFEITTTDDIITIQIAAIVKNIIAIKSGILQASDAGENARAWLITKGLQEILQISKAMGGKLETLLEPAVVGDLILTCYSMESRNTKFGFQFHQNNYSKGFVENYPILVEGVEATKLIKALISKYKVNLKDLPIINSVVELLHG